MSVFDAQYGLEPAMTGQTLAGIKVCLIFEHSLSHNARIRDEIEVLQAAGATVELLTSSPGADDHPAGMKCVRAPLLFTYALQPSSPGKARPGWIEARVRAVLYRLAANYHRVLGRELAVRRRALREAVKRVDMLWVIDEPSLPSALTAATGTSVGVVYETVDLVPEYGYMGQEYRAKRLEEERRLLSRVDGFVTACDSYADYYMERYGGCELARRPVVRDNMPVHIVSGVRATARPLRFLFMGSLMFDRPVLELIEAFALVNTEASLTFQGKDHLDGAASSHIDRLGLTNVEVLEPCPPDEIVATASEYDVGIVALRGENENERRASTSKLFTYMAAGLAVLGSDLPGIARVVNECHNGLLVGGMEPEAWARSIDRLGESTAELDEMKRRSLEGARLRSWDRQRPVFIGEFVRAAKGLR